MNETRGPGPVQRIRLDPGEEPAFIFEVRSA
jgi:hypothetical protein